MLRVRTVDARTTPGARLPPRADAAAPERGVRADEADDDIGGVGDRGVDAAALVARRAGPRRRCAPSRGPALRRTVRRRDVVAIEGGDGDDAAPELARLSLNVAKAHPDAGASAHGRRLVYGGHAIGIAAAARHCARSRTS